MYKLLFISHALSRTGAPLVLEDMIFACVDAGHSAGVIAMEDGPLREDFQQRGIPLVIADVFLDGLPEWQALFRKYDAVIVNTLVGIEAVYAINTTDVPTLWWIHEHEYWFMHYKPILPKPADLKSNIHIYGVSPVTNELITAYAGYNAGLLPFGIKDRAHAFIHAKDENIEGKVRFILPGTISFVKGQDILCDAAALLPEHIRKNCIFIIVGAQNPGENDFYEQIKNKSGRIDEIRLLDGCSHDEALKLIAESDYLIAPSRMEPFSAITVEAMMLSTVPIVSNICGVTAFLNDRKDSCIFKSESAEDLCEAIREAFFIKQNNEISILMRKARLNFEQHFSLNVFSQRISAILDEII